MNAVAIDPKRFATLQARCALRGWELVELADGTLLAGRWGRTRHFPDVEALEAFLKHLETGPARG